MRFRDGRDRRVPERAAEVGLPRRGRLADHQRPRGEVTQAPARSVDQHHQDADHQEQVDDPEEVADERGAEASPKFRVLLTTSLVSSLIMFDSSIVAVSLPSIGRSLGASFADVQWVISAYVLILINERETAPMRAEAPAKMPSKLIDCRDPL